MIRFRCPQCRGFLEVSENNSGEEINCLGCGSRVQIPPPQDDYFRFPCPSCGKRLKAKPQDTGKNTHCTKCGRRFLVPAIAPPKPAESALPKPRAAVVEPARANIPVPKAVGPTPVSVTCPSCGASLKAPDNAFGKRFQCPKCSMPVQVPEGPSSGSLPNWMNQVESYRDRTSPPPVRVPPRAMAETDVQLVRADSKTCPFCGEQVLAVAKKCKHCGEMIDVVLRAAEEAKRASEKETATPMVFMNAAVGASSSGSDGGRTVIVTPGKSVGLAILLTFLFGPLGMLYSTIAGALIMFLVSVFLAVLTLGFSVVITWPICIIWAAVAASNHNAVRVIRD